MPELFRTYRNHLPHWRLDGAIYFVTWRLHPSQVPLEPEERSIVREALHYADGKQFDLLAHVVMDDHLHLDVVPNRDVPLETIVHSWRSFTTNALHKRRFGRIWQKDYFDRIVRDERELAETIQYIVGNPSRRWPGIESYEWVGMKTFKG